MVFVSGNVRERICWRSSGGRVSRLAIVGGGIMSRRGQGKPEMT